MRCAAITLALALVMLALAKAGDAAAQVIDCSQAQADAASVICADEGLGELEAERAALSRGKPDAVTDEAWRAQLQGCGGDRECLTTAYLNEIQRLRLSANAEPETVESAAAPVPETVASAQPTNGCEPDRTFGVNCQTPLGYFRQCDTVPSLGPRPSELATCVDEAGVRRIVIIATGEIRDASADQIAPYSEQQAQINNEASAACANVDGHIAREQCMEARGYRLMEASPAEQLFFSVVIVAFFVGIAGIVIWLVSTQTGRRILMFFVGLAFARSVYRYMNEPRRR